MEAVLLAESDEVYLRMLSSLINDSGFHALEATSHLNAFSILRDKTPSLVILSWNFNDIGGEQFLSSLKENPDYSWLPVITLHEQGSDSSRVQSLRIGSEDCLSKPIDPHELVLRIKSIFRRKENTNFQDNEGIIELNGLKLDTKSLRVKGKSKSTYLPSTDFKLLLALMSNPGEVISRTKLKEFTSHKIKDVDDRLVDVHVMRLRRTLKKIGYSDIIQTVRGVGYRITD